MSEEIGREDTVWAPYIQWDGETVTRLWSTIWYKLDPYLRTKTQRDKNSSTTYHKSWQGHIARRTRYKKCTQKCCSKVIRYARKKGEVKCFPPHNMIKKWLHYYSFWTADWFLDQDFTPDLNPISSLHPSCNIMLETLQV